MNTQTQPFRQLFEEGRICPARFYCMPPADIDPSLEQIVTSFTGIGHNIVAAYSSHCAGKKAVVYCATVMHAEAVAAAFNASGIPAAAVLGGQNNAERTANIERFQFGDLLVLTNVGVLLTDFRRPEVDAVIMADPTQSSTKYLQQVAAALAPRFAQGMPTLTSDQRRAAIEASSKPFAIVLDLAGNLLRHGIPDVGPAPEPEQPAEAATPKFKKGDPISYRGRNTTIVDVDAFNDGEPDYTVALPGGTEGGIREHELSAPIAQPMVTVPAANLTGPALAYAVAVAEGLGDQLAWCFREDGSFGNIWTDNHGSYCPDEDWEIGGPLIEKHGVGIERVYRGAGWGAWISLSCYESNDPDAAGPTPLIALCRAVVLAKLGGAVQVPEELTRG